ncbi:cytochrome P450 [Streptomyces sp. NPDC005962]|uniref:cytochrome P450 n=1 Tax=Streptomyces sp. NPDC005962 TaxID=3154466 RepID=UPI0033DD00C2
MPHTAGVAPSSSVDLFTDAALRDPYPLHDALRATGSVVRLDTYGVWAVTRHRAVESVLRDPTTYRSENGVALTEMANTQILAGTVLASDGEKHAQLRRVLSAQLAPRAIRHLVGTVTDRAQRLVDAALADGGQFDAAELARQMVSDTVMAQMGLEEEAREPLLAGAAPTFDTFGPDNARFQRALPIASQMVEFLHQTITRQSVVPESWMGAIFQAVDDGRLDESDAIPLTSAYTAASMDTTILGITEAIAQLARHPHQWNLLRRNPTRAATPAFHEALRLEAPIQGFGRRAARPTELDGVRIERGEQVWLLYGSAGRDEEFWGPEADAFNILRLRPERHLAFGAGPHLCAGIPLAELQARAVLRALAARCTRLTICREPVRVLNNVLHGWGQLPVAVELGPRGPSVSMNAAEHACERGTAS